jgi:cystathionine beta-lyase/cystathionine gamma-synthase
MNNLADTQTGSSDSSVLNNEVENKKAIKEIQEKLNELMPSLNNSVNLTTIKDLELRVSNLEENVEKILKILESKKIE